MVISRDPDGGKAVAERFSAWPSSTPKEPMSNDHRRPVTTQGGEPLGRPVRVRTVPELEALSRTTHFDWRLTPYDLAGSRAHARVLHAAGLLSRADRRRARADRRARRRRRVRCLHGRSPTTRTCTGRSKRPARRLGPEIGGKLRAGRSRNDQIATLFKVFLRDHGRVDRRLVRDLVEALAARPRPPRRRRCPDARTSSTRSRCCCRTT